MRNRQQPPSGLSGEILSNSAPDPFQSGRSVEGRAGHLPTAGDFNGVFNISPTLKAWGQKRGMESLARAIDAYTGAVRSRQRLAEAIIDVELVETRLNNIDKLKAAAVIDIEKKLQAQEADLDDQRHQVELRRLSQELEKEEITIKLLNARYRRKREEEKLNGNIAPEKNLEEQVAALSEELIAAQRELTDGQAAGRLSEAEIHVKETNISAILRKLDKLRQQDEQT